MKRISFCSFALVFWLIAFSTFFSIRVEQWMTPVITTTASNQFDELPLDCLQWEDEMNARLFTVQEGTNWSLGTRAREVSPLQYMILPEAVSLVAGGGGYGSSYIRYSTKRVEDGGLVEKKQGKTEKLPDNLLVYQEEDSAPTLQGEEVEQPFMEKREMAKLEAAKVYSLNELTAFFRQVLVLSILPAEFFLLLGLWAASLRLAKEPRNNRKVLGINLLLALLLLGTVPLILGAVTLAQSLLPQDIIVEAGHYTREFSEIFSALERFVAEGNQTAGAALSQVHTDLWISLGILLAGVGLGVGAFFFETARHPRKIARKSRQKHIPRHGRA